MSRNTWILVGVAAVAFGAFLLFGVGEDSSPSGVGSGFLRLFRGGGERTAGEVTARSAAPGGPGLTGSELARRRAAAAAVAKRLKKNRNRPGGPPDPELLRRMQAGGGGLVATSPAQAPREGIVQQSFRAGKSGASGDNGTVVNGGAGTGEDDTGDAGPQDPSKCGAPTVQKTVVDLQKTPLLRAAFDVPSSSLLIKRGLGELFKVGDAPAFVILIPSTKSASAGALFDDRFLVLIKGKCIPNRQYVKALLRQ